MKLFLDLQKHKQLASTDEFVYSVLNRLTLTETLTAASFQNAKSLSSLRCHDVAPLIKEAGEQYHFTTEQHQSITAIFQEINALSQLITQACFHNECIQQVANKPQNRGFENTMKTQLDAQSWKVIECLTTPEKINDIDIITNTLINVFPDIDQKALTNTISRMKNPIHRLQNPGPVEAVQRGWNDVSTSSSTLSECSSGMFYAKPEGVDVITEEKTSEAVAENAGGCTIS